MKSLLLFIVLIIGLTSTVSSQTYNHNVKFLDEGIFDDLVESSEYENRTFVNNNVKYQLKSTLNSHPISAEEYSYLSVNDSALIALYYYTYNNINLRLKDVKEEFDESSGQWYVSEEVDYLYNDYNQLISVIEKRRSIASESLTFTYKEEYDYDQYGNRVLVAGYFYEMDTWEGDYRTEYEFNSNGERTIWSRFEWVNGEWECNFQDQYDYDQWGNQIMFYALRWNYSQSALQPNHLYEYEYNAEGHQLERRLFLQWENNEWLTRVRYRYQRNSEGHWTHCDKDEWINNAWQKVREGLPHYSPGNNLFIDWVDYENGMLTKPFSNRSFLRMASGRTSLHLTSLYNEVTGSWEQDDRDEYAYDTNGNLILQIDYDWNDNSNNWIGRYKWVNEYDQYGNKVLYQSYSWDYELHNFKLTYQYENAFDSNGNRTLFARYNSDPEKNMVGLDKKTWVYDEANSLLQTSDYYWDQYTSSWVKAVSVFYINSAQPTQIFGLGQNDEIFSYHVQDNILYVKSVSSVETLYTISLFNIEGKKVIEKKGEGGELKLNVSHLSKGTYLIQNTAQPSISTKVLIP